MIMMNDMVCTLVKAKENLSNKIKSVRFNESKINKIQYKMISKEVCTMGRKRTHEQYVREVAQINPNLSVIERYLNNRTAILHRCNIDQYEWRAVPYSILQGKGCPMCAGNAKRTHSQYVADLMGVNVNIEPIEEYVNTDTSILHKCKICEHVWSIKPNHTLNGHGCPMCGFKSSADSKRKSQDEYIQELFYVNQDIEVVGEYINYITPLLHRCKKCGNEWYAKPCHTMRGHGCSVCNESHGERGIAQWLGYNHIKYMPQYRFEDCRDKYPLPFDFYLPQYNTCIEYNGRQHYKPIGFFGGEDAFKIRQQHDKIKKNYCQRNNIDLLCISYKQDIAEELNKILLI